MKKLVFISLLAAAACGLTAILTCQATNLLFGERLKGSNRIVTRTVEAPDYDAISASRAIRVVVTDRTDKIRIEANDNLIDRVIVETKGHTLHITIDPKITKISNARVTVTVPARDGRIRALEASSTAEITCEVPLQAELARIEASSAAKIRTSCRAGRCKVSASSAAGIDAEITAASCSFEASSAAGIDAKVEAAECSAGASSAAKIELEGSAGEFSARASSAGKVEAEDLVCEQGDAEASSGAGIHIHCSKQLNARASSGGALRYTGDCAVDAKESSGGSVRRK